MYVKAGSILRSASLNSLFALFLFTAPPILRLATTALAESSAGNL